VGGFAPKRGGGNADGRGPLAAGGVLGLFSSGFAPNGETGLVVGEEGVPNAGRFGWRGALGSFVFSSGFGDEDGPNGDAGLKGVLG
jgi:hypothetical protein